MAEGGYSQSPEKFPREEQATPYPQQRAWALSVPGNSLEGKERREGEEKGRWERGRKVGEEGRGGRGGEGKSKDFAAFITSVSSCHSRNGRSQ